MDREAEFLKRFLTCQDDLRAVIGSMLRDRHLREDVFQDVAVVLWRKFDEYDPSRPFGAWARGIAVRKVLQTYDKSRRLPIAFAPETIDVLLRAFDEAEEPDRAAEEQALRRCVEKLPEKSRRLLELRYEKALKLHEIAERIASTLDAVHKALSRMREALRRCVAREMAANG
jgi:RNA polymerase sigma-70 factor (ECF subfamily)